ncbi:hypothetical protein DCO48_08375 [Pseudomonas sp. SDI]|uniref:hypothetical protein n=1 Tax=Pseudomonas sp. SDI TaxID=2170734 RepID=UPI000DE5FCF6|nr:hypothetical protein [Pseudomonas sp. SDI]PWB33985.1 hypothetical protein DCO48_08375 [Pseudomonas sp. SDI]
MGKLQQAGLPALLQRPCQLGKPLFWLAFIHHADHDCCSTSSPPAALLLPEQQPPADCCPSNTLGPAIRRQALPIKALPALAQNLLQPGNALQPVHSRKPLS